MSPRTVLTPIVSGLLCGCVSTVTIDVDETSSFSQLEASIPISADKRTRLRLRGARVDGEDSQTLEFDERITAGSSSIFGPAEVDVELDLSYYSIAIGNESDPGDSLKSSMYLGISQTRFDLTISGDNNRLRSSDDTTEAYLQFGLAAAVTGSLDLGFSAAFSLGRNLSGVSEFDLKLDYRLAENLVLTGGYRWFEYQYGLGDDDSNLEVNFRGPFLGVYLPF